MQIAINKEVLLVSKIDRIDQELKELNGHYSDSECCLWEAMRRVLRAERKL